jgi:bis(5'-nucleosyl)-tetraphosphatase (symmetrical)
MAKGRRIFVGDIQGCLQPLRRLLRAVEFREGEDRLLPTGDVVNKGPDSEGVLRLLMDVGAESVMGNHDLYWGERKSRGDRGVEWLRQQPVVRVFDDIILVHAGLHPAWDDAKLLAPFDAEDVEFATTVRYCTASGARPERDYPPPGPPFRPWHEFYRGKRRVVFGHWARQGLVRTKRVIGLDTGCVYGDQLSAWIAEEDRIVQVRGEG